MKSAKMRKTKFYYFYFLHLFEKNNKKLKLFLKNEDSFDYMLYEKLMKEVSTSFLNFTLRKEIDTNG